METSNYLDILLGEENLNGSSALLRGFWCPTTSPEHAGLSETSVIKAAQFRYGGLAKINSTTGPAFTGIKTIFGQWDALRLKIPNGQVLKFQGKRSTNGRIEAYANMYIGIRASAALRECRLKLTSQTNSINPYAYIRGHFDILTTDQVQAMGVLILPAFMAMADSGKVANAFMNIEIEPEKQAASRVELVSVRPILARKNADKIVIAAPIHTIKKR